MHRNLLSALTPLLLPALWACDGSTPTVKQSTLPGIIPHNATRTPGRSVHALTAPSGSNPQDQGECAAWATDQESYDPATGNFDYLYSCASGGAIASVHTSGHDDGLGNGTYQTVYGNRDGSQVTWDFSYTLAADGETVVSHGSSSAGESDDSEQRTLADGSTESRDTFHAAAGDYTSDGVYSPDGRFNGTSSFEDPATVASPDYHLTQSQPADGTFEQIVDGVSEGWGYHYRYAVAADGQAEYQFESDDPATQADDYAGSYHYNSDGSGRGSYRQLFDDGSTLDVSDAWTLVADDELWTYDDPSTGASPDQNGQLHYVSDGSATGSLTTHVTGGADETCDLAVAADGTVTVSNCR